jgi:hypothetical protein
MTTKTSNASNRRSGPLGLAAKTSTLIAALIFAAGLGSAFAADFCVNPGFEDGPGGGGNASAPPWSFWGGTGGAIDNPVPVVGVNETPRVWSNFGNPEYVNVASQNNMNDVWLIPGATYHVHAQYYVPSSEIVSGTVPRAGIYLSLATAPFTQIRVLDPRYPDNAGNPAPATIPVTDAWYTYDFDWVCPATDASGNSFNGMPVQNNYLSFRLYGGNGTALGGAGNPINPGGYFDNCQFSSAAYTGVIGGKVKTSAGWLQGATVTLSYKGGNFRTTPVGPITTLFDGAYSFASLIPGETYSINASKAGYAPVTVTAVASAVVPDITLASATPILQPMLVNKGSGGWRGPADIYTIGTTFTTGPNPVSVTALGFVDHNLDGLNVSHQVGIWQGSTLVASVTVPAGTVGTLNGDFRYVGLGALVTLAANTTYSVNAYTGGDDWPDTAPNPGFGTPDFDGFVSLNSCARDANAEFGAPTFTWGNAGNVGACCNLIGSTVAPTVHTITATSGTGGSITPGTVIVANGGSQGFAFTPAFGYVINDVLVDLVSNPGAVAAGNYTFSGVVGDHTISVSWTALPTISGTVSGPGGPIYSALVTLSTNPDGSSPVQSTMTDALGAYILIPPVSSGSYYLIARKGGFVTPAVKTVVMAGSPVPGQNFTLANSAGLDPLVVLDASALTVGTDLASWPNAGSLGGSFDKYTGGTGPDVVADIAGKQAVQFVQPDSSDPNRRTLASAVLTPAQVAGNSDWTVSADLYKDDMSWTGDNAFLSLAGFQHGAPKSDEFCYVNNKVVDHSGSGWGFATVPSAGAWHNVTITYDGTSEKIYVDGVLDNSRGIALNIATGDQMIVGSTTDVTGPARQWNDSYWRYNGAIAKLQIFDQALTADQVGILNGFVSRTVTGTVKDGGGIGVVGASVTLKNGLGTVVAGPVSSGALGAYTLTAVLPEGGYTVHASALGYSLGTTPLTVTADTAYPGTDITITELAPLVALVDVTAADLTPGSAVSSWVNNGTLGGSFIPAPTNSAPDQNNGFGHAPLTATVGGGKKAAWFANNPQVLVDGSGNAIQLPDSVLGTFDPGTGDSLTSPVFTMAAWVYKQQLLTGNESAYCSMAPFAYGASFFYGDNWAVDTYMAGGSIGFTAQPAAGSWHQIVASCDGSTLSLYVDGVLNNSVTPGPGCIAARDPGWWGPAGGATGTYLGASNPVLLGATAWGWPPNPPNDPGYGEERSYTGFLGGLRIYNQGLSADQVAALYVSSVPPTEATYTVSGYVYGPDGSTGINGATVSVTAGGALVTAPVTTAGGGAYTVTVGPGTYNLTALGSGYLAATHTGVVVAGNVTGENFTLAAIPADRMAISITASEATAGGVVNHGYYSGSFVPAQGTPTVGLAGPSGDQRSAITFGNNSRWHLQQGGSDVPAGGEVCGNSPFTVVAWVYQDSTVVNQNNGPRNMYFTWSPLGAPGAAGCGLGWRTWGGAFPGFDSANTPVVCWDGYSDDFSTALGSGLMPWDAWNQIVTKYDGTALHFYKNGIEVIGGTTSSVMPRTYNLQTTAGNPFDLGGFSNGWGDAFYQGSIARLKMYSKALTQAEIDADFANPPVLITSISGRVTDGANPIYNAVVQVGGNTGPAAITGTDGSYSISGITPGEGIEVYADALGYADNAQTTTIVAGPNTLDITLAAKAETDYSYGQNGGFETLDPGTGKPANWHDWAGSNFPGVSGSGYVPGLGDDYIHSTSVAGEFFSGTKGAKYTPVGDNYTFLAQLVPVVAGSTYSCYWKMKGDPGITSAFPFVEFRDADGNDVGNALYIGYNVAVPTVWTQYPTTDAERGAACRIAIPAGAVYMSIILGCVSAPPNGDGNPWVPGNSLYVDDVVIDRVGPVAPPLTPPTPVLPPGSFSMPGGTPTFTGIATESGWTYYLVWKKALTDSTWTRVTPGTAGDGNPHDFTDTTPDPAQRFYRLEVQ